jgi:GNAT superfamily N-acetyltransferase
MTQVETRSAQASDVTAITRLVGQLGYAASEADIARRLDQLLADPNQLLVLAVREDAVLGFIAAEQRLILETGHFIEIVGLVVAVEARKLGIGGQLLDVAEAWARQRGMASIRVRSNTARVESHPFYESHGYARKKTQHVYAKNLEG